MKVKNVNNVLTLTGPPKELDDVLHWFFSDDIIKNVSIKKVDEKTIELHKKVT